MQHNSVASGVAEMCGRVDGVGTTIEPSERGRVQAELDAVAFHAYGLDQEQTASVLDGFHQVQNPRQMTDQYFQLVLECYGNLAADTESSSDRKTTE